MFRGLSTFISATWGTERKYFEGRSGKTGWSLRRKQQVDRVSYEGSDKSEKWSGCPLWRRIIMAHLNILRVLFLSGKGIRYLFQVLFSSACYTCIRTIWSVCLLGRVVQLLLFTFSPPSWSLFEISKSYTVKIKRQISDFWKIVNKSEKGLQSWNYVHEQIRSWPINKKLLPIISRYIYLHGVVSCSLPARFKSYFELTIRFFFLHTIYYHRGITFRKFLLLHCN